MLTYSEYGLPAEVIAEVVDIWRTGHDAAVSKGTGSSKWQAAAVANVEGAGAAAATAEGGDAATTNDTGLASVVGAVEVAQQLPRPDWLGDAKSLDAVCKVARSHPAVQQGKDPKKAEAARMGAEAVAAKRRKVACTPAGPSSG